jgi:tRNA-2-methylthio-N6-dimethylallyladenosine synthase
MSARTGNNRIVNFAGPPELMHRFVNLKITEARAHTLRGEAV